jgi:tetratricopeptide (TPR) repeat protein
VGGGLLLIALTFTSYKPGSTSYPSKSHEKMSAAEAERRTAAARSQLQSNPEDLPALTDLAISLYHAGPEKYVDAMNALEKARSLGAVDPNLFFYAGAMYETLGLPEYAANDLKKYLRHNPKDYEALVRLGNVYYQADRNEEAEALYRDAVEQWKKDPTVWFNYGVVSVRRGNFDMAQECFERVRELIGTLPEGGLFQEGEIKRQKGDETAAVELYQQEVAKNPGFVPALQALDALYRKQKRYKEAGEVRKRIREIRESSSTVKADGQV